MPARRAPLLLLPLLPVACAPYPEGLRATPDGDGPVVRYDWEAEPMPDIPFPSDLATRVDRSSPTGLRLNISTQARTFRESDNRRRLNELSGFGVYSPIWAGVDGEDLDLDDIAARHKQDGRVGPERLDDDAVFLIDVDPDSPDYLKAVPIDLGEGRYPYDVPNPDRYFPVSLNGVGLPTLDPHGDSPTLAFETHEEDLNGNGELDQGEDVDDDGVLDHPNVWPVGGDPRADLLTWYERETRSLILRPVRPLREETTYAVVFTSRLVGAESGEPVRSPWAYVNHTRQTEALRPLEQALPDLGLGLEDVAFAWSFTTARVTGDLVDVSRGLRGEGPFAQLQQTFPAGVRTAELMHELPDEARSWWLPAGIVAETFEQLGVFDPEREGPIFVENYSTFTDAVVGGTFETADLLVDRDDGGAWPVDDAWELDAMTGQIVAGGSRVVFTCMVPRESERAQQPFPVAIWGHGYGSSRFDTFVFAWAMNRVGVAACGLDAPGHGVSVDAQDDALIRGILSGKGLLPFYEHLLDARHRDMNNDGTRDSGGDQWSADAFHTRDMVRQNAVDWAQLVLSLQQCGQGTMRLPGGGEAVACDWDGNGVPDIGGPDVAYSGSGGSLGGINAAVAAGVLPEVTSWAPIVPGGGLLDVALRTEIGGAVEAMEGRLMSPILAGYPTEDGGLQVVQITNSVVDMATLPVARLVQAPGDGFVRLTNLVNGEVVEGRARADGSFRLHIAADAVGAYDKARLAGIPEEGPEPGATYYLEDPTLAGDELRIEIFGSDGALWTTIDAWEDDTLHEGITYPAGSPLVAANEGFGHRRNTPDLRRLAFVFASILEPGDPIAYGPTWWERSPSTLSGFPKNVLVMPTPGDTIVNAATGIALARSAGLIPQDEVDARYGKTVDAWLVEKGVIQGLEEWGGQSCEDGSACLFDADDLDAGMDGTGAPSEQPLRLTMEAAGGVNGMRLPYVRTTGQHGFSTPDPTLPFDINTFAVFQIATYLASDGAQLSDDACLEDASCDWIPALTEAE